MRKNIALYVSYLDNEFSRDIIDGANIAAIERDVNIFILPTRLLKNDYYALANTLYEYQYNTMFSYADYTSIDGIIFESGIIGNGCSDDELKEHMKQFGDVPIVSISRKIEGYPNICFNSHGLRDEIQHLINVHGCKRIGFIGGPPSNPEAYERFMLYKETLADNGIAYDEKLYGISDFSEYCEKAVRNVLELNKGNIDALCFANDRMAIGGYNVLAEMRLTPSKDICVTGFDDAPSAAAMNPMLTTVRSNITMLGYHALCQCVDIANGKEPADMNIDTSIIVRSSCGCPSKVTVINEKIATVGSVANMDADCLCNEVKILLSGSLSSDSAASKRIAELAELSRKLIADISTPGFESDKQLDKLYDVIDQFDFETVSFIEFRLLLGLYGKRLLQAHITERSPRTSSLI